MRFGTRTPPMVGLRATLSRLAATTPTKSARPLSWVIDGWVAHRVALTVA
ncbi:MAG: hypothetical protein ACRDQU_15225 [Pseudonocardiaceae bacterium]